MKKIGMIFNGVWSQYTFAMAPKYRPYYELMYVHDLTEATLARVEALVVPFQTHHPALAAHKEAIYKFLAAGKKVFVAGDSSARWIDATWEDRPVNNYWWVTDPHSPPVSDTDYSHPLFQGLKPRHAFWHYHGVYTQVPAHARIIQTNREGDVVTWQSAHYGGELLVTTLDPIVEHGVQQIKHLDNFCDKLTHWLCGESPRGEFTILHDDYGVAYPA